MIENFYRGDTVEYNITLTGEDGNPFPLTNATIYFTMKSDIALPDEEAEIQIEITEHEDAENGVTYLHIPNELTEQLTPNKKYYYDFQLNIDGKVFTLLSGKVKVLQDVTFKGD